MSIAGGFWRAIHRGMELGCEAIQIFTKNTNQWRAKPLERDEILKWNSARSESGIHPIVAHSSYLINIGTDDGSLWEKSIASLECELERCEVLAIPYFVLHPGSHRGRGAEYGLKRAAEALNRVHGEHSDWRVVICIEHMSGQGNVLCSSLEETARLLNLVEDKKRMGVCLDTCHLFEAGYDYRTPRRYLSFMRQLDETVGAHFVKCWHINDSKSALGSRVDRHQHIGQGEIGCKGIALVLNDPQWLDHPMLLETPKEKDPLLWDRKNLQVLRELRQA